MNKIWTKEIIHTYKMTLILKMKVREENEFRTTPLEGRAELTYLPNSLKENVQKAILDVFNTKKPAQELAEAEVKPDLISRRLFRREHNTIPKVWHISSWFELI